MSIFRRFARRRQPASPREFDTLREFVYLDEVSLISLLTSKRQGVVAELTNNETLARSDEISGQLEASAVVVKSSITPTKTTAETRGTQVVRKATIQATFTEFFKLVASELLLQGLPAPPARDAVERDPAAALVAAARDRLAVPLPEITRGRLLEIEVELTAEYLYRFSTVMRSFLELVEEAPELFGASLDQFGQAIAIPPILDKMLVGMVPLRGRAVNYVVARVGEEEWVVHRKVAERLRGAHLSDLEVVGLADSRLLWKDIRLVAFSRARYFGLCRIERSGLHDSWTSLRIFDVLRDIAPEVASQLGASGEGIIGSVRGASASTGHATDQLRAALFQYGEALAKRAGVHFDPSLVPESSAIGGTELEVIRGPFDELTRRLVAGGHTAAPGHEVQVELRFEALAAHGLLPLTQRTSVPGVPAIDSRPTRILDTEFIAIYW